jgi:hypothetical protein
MEKNDINDLWIDIDIGTPFFMPNQEMSDWKCYLFGSDGITFQPEKGKEPNWFWRMMQYLLLGNRWVKEYVKEEPEFKFPDYYKGKS